jgi:hypothetical protein
VVEIKPLGILVELLTAEQLVSNQEVPRQLDLNREVATLLQAEQVAHLLDRHLQIAQVVAQRLGVFQTRLQLQGERIRLLQQERIILQRKAILIL